MKQVTYSLFPAKFLYTGSFLNFSPIISLLSGSSSSSLSISDRCSKIQKKKKKLNYCVFIIITADGSLQNEEM